MRLLLLLALGLPVAAFPLASRPASPGWLGIHAALVAIVALAVAWAALASQADHPPASGWASGWAPGWALGGFAVLVALWLAAGLARARGLALPELDPPWVRPNPGMVANPHAVPWWAIAPAAAAGLAAAWRSGGPGDAARAYLAGAACFTLLNAFLGGPVPMLAKFLAAGLGVWAAVLAGRAWRALARGSGEDPVWAQTARAAACLLPALGLLMAYRLDPAASWAPPAAAVLALGGLVVAARRDT